MAAEFTLAELAERLGILPRTIRSYIEQGLLRGPEVGGRGARYTDYHVQRLQAIQTLKDVRGLPLAEVRKWLMSATAPELQQLAKEATIAKAPLPIAEAVSALDYIKRLQHGNTSEPIALVASAGQNSMDVLLARLGQLTRGGTSPPRRARGEVWTSVPVTPDIEIRVRGTLTVDQISRWERIADHFREILMGGAPEE